MQFNAHRIFKPDSILKWQSDYSINLTSFSFVDDQGDLHKEVGLDAVPTHIKYGCGIYTFKKN